jgi:hypothetical protein
MLSPITEQPEQSINQYDDEEEDNDYYNNRRPAGTANADQIDADEEMARRLHEEMNGAPPRVRRGRGFRWFVSHHDFYVFRIWRKGGCLHGKEREFLHLYLQHASHFQGGVYRRRKKKKREFMENKGREFGCQFYYTDHFSEFGGYFTGEQTKHEIPF